MLQPNPINYSLTAYKQSLNKLLEEILIMTAAELKNRTLVAAALAKQKGFMHTYDALIAIVQGLEGDRLLQGRVSERTQTIQHSQNH